MQQSNPRIKIGIIRGGVENYKDSLLEGKEILSFLNENLYNKYETIDIFLDKENTAHVHGLPVRLDSLLHKANIVWNTNPYLVNDLENLSIKNISISPFSNIFSNHRSMLEENAKNIDLQMPRHFVIPAYQYDFDGDMDKFAFRKAKEVFEKFGSPWIVHSFGKDSNTGIHIAKTFEQLVDSILDIARSNKSILVEEFITGKVVSLHSVPRFRNQDLYIMHSSNLNMGEKEKLLSAVKNLHSHINAAHYLKSSFVINKRGNIYLINIDLKPNLKEYSDLWNTCENRGLKVSQVLEHIIDQALK